MAKQIEDLEKKAAQSTTTANNMIGIRRGELLRSVAILAGHAIKQPKPLAKNIVKLWQRTWQNRQGHIRASARAP